MVENEVYGAEVGRYIHLNPVRIRSRLNDAIGARRKTVRSHRWNSYGALIGHRSCPRWLDRKSLLRAWGANVKEQQKNYSSFVEEGLVRDIDDISQFYNELAACGLFIYLYRICTIYLRIGLIPIPRNLFVLITHDSLLSPKTGSEYINPSYCSPSKKNYFTL